MGRKQKKKKKTQAPLRQRSNNRVKDEDTLEGAVGYDFDKGDAATRSELREQNDDQYGVFSNDDFPPLKRSNSKPTGFHNKPEGENLQTNIHEQLQSNDIKKVVTNKSDSNKLDEGVQRETSSDDTERDESASKEQEASDKHSGNVTVNQSVSGVHAKYIQIGQRNTMEVTDQDDVGQVRHTTNIGENNALNVFDGQPSMRDISIKTTGGKGVKDPICKQPIAYEEQMKSGSQVIQNVKADRVQINQIVHKHEQNTSQVQPQLQFKQFDKFSKAVKRFGDGHYILIMDTTKYVKHIDAIGRAPWTAVFDFDEESRRTGLLSYVEEIIENQRSLNLYTWQEKSHFTEHGTSWIFMNGNSQEPDSVICCNPKDWKKKVRDSLKSSITQLKNFGNACTEFTVVVMWPQDGTNVHQINHLLTTLCDELSATVLIVDEGCQNTYDTHVLKAYLNMDAEATSVQLSLEDVCTVIDRMLPNQKLNKCDYGLPNNNGTKATDITEKQAHTIAEDLEVLYLTNKTGIEHTSDQLKQEEDSFYRGGTLRWSWWYQVRPGHVDIERDIFSKIRDFIIKEHIETFKPGTITICHNPGSGGTTLAQRILWDLKDKAPCAQVKLNTGSSADNVMESIQLLGNKTNLPVILLMDGEEERRVQSLQKVTRDRCCLIIIYVKRCSHGRKGDSVGKNDATFWLAENISKKESKILDLKYRNVVTDSTKRKSVERMHSNIRKGHSHSLFEFGLEIHNHNYSGLESYVSGFLKLQENTRGELEPFQNVLGMLSLVYYYGQATVPCHFFSNIFDFKRDHKLLRLDDFPRQMHGLVVQDEMYGRRNGVRICHVLVAKEILDQILIFSQGQQFQRRLRSPFICKNAKESLAPFAISFIKYAGERDNGKSAVIRKIVTRTFISRDNKPIGESENEMHDTKVRKPRLSAILEDVTNTAPYTKRFEVLEQLTNSFPEESQYLAHLGRLYTICLPEEHDKAEQCFRRALDICNDQTDGRRFEEIPHNMKLTLMYVYHMYGNMLSLWVSRYTPRYFGDKPKKRVLEGDFENIARMLLKHTSKACDFFDNCREITPVGCEQSCSYIGEISVRLMLCNFVLQHGDAKNLHEYMERNENALKDFLEESSEKLDELFIDCLSVIEPDQMDEQIVACNMWYSQLFKTRRSSVLIERRFANKPENLHTRRLRIAIVKMNYNDRDSAGILESVDRKGDILYIVQQYECNFADVNHQSLTKRQHDIDYREWLFAIRHRQYPKERSLYEVLEFVQQWYDRHRTPYARFYLFILKSLIGFGDKTYLEENTEVLLESQRLRTEVTELSRFVTKPKYPREWLGPANKGIRRLVPGRRFFGLFEYQEDEPQMEIMIGTICPPNDRLASGYINLDLGPHTPVTIKVFFIPARSDMKGSRNKNARVEFQLGFSMSHGYEAFNVRSLKNIKCTNCGRKVEYRSCDSEIVCSTCKTVQPRKKENDAVTQHTN